MKIFRKPTVALGIDVGTHTVKAVQLSRHGPSNFTLLAAGIAEINQKENDPFQPTILALNTALKDCDPTRSRIISAVSGSSTVLKEVSFPTASSKEIQASLRWEASQHIPVPLDTVKLTFQVRKVSKDEKTSEVLLVAVAREHLQNHLRLLHQIKLQPHIVDVGPLALVNAYLAFTPDHDENKNFAILEIGASTTTIIIFRKAGFFFARDILIGGNKFTAEVKDKYHLDYAQAELAKREASVDLSVCKVTLNQLLLEIRQSLLYYDTRTGNNGYEEVALCGGGANLEGLSTYLEQNLNLPMVHFRPLQHMSRVEASPSLDLESMELQFGVATGLALRG